MRKLIILFIIVSALACDAQGIKERFDTYMNELNQKEMKRINQVKKMCEIMDLSDYYFGAIQEAIFIKRGSDNYSKMESFIIKEADTNPCKESVEELREICKMIINNDN